MIQHSPEKEGACKYASRKKDDHLFLIFKRRDSSPLSKTNKATWQYSSFIDKCHLIASKQAHYFDPVLST